MGSVISAGFLTGPILGGFWLSISGGDPSSLSIYPSVPLESTCPQNSSTEMALPRKREWIFGERFLIFLFLAFLLLFLNRMSRGSDPLVWAWLFLLLLCLGLFILVELRSPSPLVDLNLFRRRLFVSSLGASFLSFWMGAAHTFVMPFFLQDILEFSPAKAGMFIFPIALTVMVTAPWGKIFGPRGSQNSSDHRVDADGDDRLFLYVIEAKCE